MNEELATSLKAGADAIRSAAKTLPDAPGVYRMLDENGGVLYVGKARALKRRVASYSHVNKLPNRLKRMVSLTRAMEFVVTGTEAEALLLEVNLIKKFSPAFNVLFKDDKSFPYALVTGGHAFPQLRKHRGEKKHKGEYFGPFASAGDLNRTLIALQKAFMLRNCTDSFFAARKRPCLQYHIKRCTAPCVGYVDEDAYGEQVREAVEFLSGGSHAVQDRLARQMLKASENQDYETAARLRDRIKALSSIQASQIINVEGIKNADVIAAVEGEHQFCLQVFFFRAGQNFGNRSWFYPREADITAENIISGFLTQFYAGKPVPEEIILSHRPEDAEFFEQAFSEAQGRKIRITTPARGVRHELLTFVSRNAAGALSRHAAGHAASRIALEGLKELFGLDDPPARIEVYDNSHVSGTNMTGAMIVAGPDGYIKDAYRKYNIREAAKSDDYGMMREVMERRFGRALREDPERLSGNWPDLIIIDGGAGQLGAVHDVLEELGIEDDFAVAAMSKGPDRHAGREQFHMKGRESFTLPKGDPVLLYLQRLRDEAHRFAIGAHRKRRSGALSRSALDDIPGIGAKRKKALLLHFGSVKAVSRAGMKDLQAVEGISAAMAEVVYNYFRSH